MQNGQIPYISHPSYQNPNQCDTVVTREHTEVIRDEWRRITAAHDQIEERQEKPKPIKLNLTPYRIPNSKTR